MDNPQDALLSAVYFFIERFVQRQQLSMEVIQEYRPYLLDPTYRLNPTQHLPTKEYASATQRGYWGQNKEWRYFLHGGGCRVTHTITGEEVDWNAPDLDRFDQFWFAGWLFWFVRQNVFFREPEEDKAFSTIAATVNSQNEDVFRQNIFSVLEQLTQQGKLVYHPDRPNQYKLAV